VGHGPRRRPRYRFRAAHPGRAYAAAQRDLRCRAFWQGSAVGERRGVRPRGQPLGLEPPHLAGRGCGPIHALASDDRTHRWIISETPGIVHVLVAGGAAQLVPNVGAAPPFAESCRCHRRQTESVVQLAIGEQTAVRGDPGAMNSSLIRRSKETRRAAGRLHPSRPPFLARSVARIALKAIRESRLPVTKMPLSNGTWGSRSIGLCRRATNSRLRTVSGEKILPRHAAFQSRQVVFRGSARAARVRRCGPTRRGRSAPARFSTRLRHAAPSCHP
jgi:hypothetical protein